MWEIVERVPVCQPGDPGYRYATVAHSVFASRAAAQRFLRETKRHLGHAGYHAVGSLDSGYLFTKGDTELCVSLRRGAQAGA